MTVEACQDSEQAVRTWTATYFSPTRVGTRTPADLADVVPFIEVSQVLGSTTAAKVEEAVLDFDCYAATYAAAMALAKQVQFAWSVRMVGAYVTGIADVDVPNVAIGHVRITSAPVSRPWADTAVFRVGGTAAVATHGK